MIDSETRDFYNSQVPFYFITNSRSFFKVIKCSKQFMYLDNGNRATTQRGLNIYRTLEEVTDVVNNNYAKEIIQSYPMYKKRCTEMEEFMNKYPELFL